MIKFLVPDEVCSYCTLIEAINWIAYKSYPMEKWEDNFDRFSEGSDIRSITSYEEPEGTEIEKEMTLFFENNKDNNPFDSDEYKDLKKRKEAETERANLEEQIKRELETETAKHDLFIALKKGKISAYGMFYDNVKEGHSPLEWNDAKAWNSIYEEDFDDGAYDDKVYSLYKDDIFLNEQKVQKIPASYWRFEGISWNAGDMRCPDGRYLFIHFDFNDLIEIYEEEKPEYITIEKRGDCLFYNDELGKIKAPNKLGRKTVVDWDAVHVYIASQIVLSNGALQKQDSFAQDIQDWITKEFKKQVGLSTIKEKLKPYYQHFQK